MSVASNVVSHVELQLCRCRWPREARHALLADHAVEWTTVAARDQGHTVWLSGEARQMADLAAFLVRLHASDHLDSVRLQRSEESPGLTARRVRFSVEATRRRQA